jgi:tetratricopeptide (TPR) repeat protein
MNKRALLCFLALAPAALLSAKTATPPAVVTAAAADNPADLRRQADDLIAKKDRSAQPYLLLGRASFAEGRYGKTIGAMDKALKRDALCADAYYWKGAAYEAQGKLDEAANEYQAALKAAPGHARAQAAWKKLSDRITTADAK